MRAWLIPKQATFRWGSLPKRIRFATLDRELHSLLSHGSGNNNNNIPSEAVTLSHLISPQQQHRWLAATSRKPSYLRDEDSQSEREVVLYRRNHSRLKLTRTMFGFFSLHSAVWVWYSAYFLPALDLSNMEEWQTALIPACGLTFSAFLQCLGTIYPIRLVSKLSWKRDEKQLLLYPYEFPFIQPSKKPRVMQLGDLYLDPKSKQNQQILADCHADLSEYVGHLNLSQPNERYWFSLPYVLDIREPEDVAEPGMLLEALMRPEKMKMQPKQPHRAAAVPKSQKLYSNRPPPPPDSSKLRNIVRKRPR